MRAIAFGMDGVRAHLRGEEPMTQQGRKTRIFWYDALRVAAIFAAVSYTHLTLPTT